MLIVVYKAWVDSRQLYACWRYILITIWMRTQETRLQFRNRHHTRFTVDVRQLALRECQWPVCILTCFFSSRVSKTSDEFPTATVLLPRRWFYSSLMNFRGIGNRGYMSHSWRFIFLFILEVQWRFWSEFVPLW